MVCIFIVNSNKFESDLQIIHDTMLVQFSLQNYKCFKEEAKISFIASNYDKDTREEDNIFKIEKFGLRLLKSAVVYGANASGKTNLIKGLNFFANFISSSSKETQIDDKINIDPFLLDSNTVSSTTSFEIIFIHKDTMYRYGFELDQEKIHSEWLYQKSSTKEIELFYRDEQIFELHKSFQVSDLVERDRIRPNALLLSVAANWNDKMAKLILDWFKTLHTISGINDSDYIEYSMRRIKEQQYNEQAVDFLKVADLGIDAIKLETVKVEDFAKKLPEDLQTLLRNELKERGDADLMTGLSTYHKQYNAKGLVESFIPFSMSKEESSGTRKYFALSGPILEVLKNGDILFVDELANKLHPLLTCKLVEIFNSKELNPKNAQLVFNTHDTNLLNSGLFRRDQIWFTKKDRKGAATIYSLGDFKTDVVRKEDNFERNYIKGKYGAIPYLGDFDKLIEENFVSS